MNYDYDALRKNVNKEKVIHLGPLGLQNIKKVKKKRAKK